MQEPPARAARARAAPQPPTPHTHPTPPARYALDGALRSPTLIKKKKRSIDAPALVVIDRWRRAFSQPAFAAARAAYGVLWRQLAGFVLGMLSNLCWLVAQSP